MRTLFDSNTTKPKRPVCPRCNKKGISVYHTIETFRSRDCQYCKYTEFQTFTFTGWSRDGGWETTASDAERMNSYNGQG